MFSSITQSPQKGSRRTATLCSVVVHLAGVAALWTAGRAITAPSIPQHEQRESVLIVSPPPRLFRPKTQPKTAVKRFKPERTVARRIPEPVRVEPEAPKIAVQPAPAPILPMEPAVAVTRPAAKPAGFAEVARAAAPKLELESRSAAFGAAMGKREPTTVAPLNRATGFGTADRAKTQAPTLATGDGGFGGVEIGRAEKRVEQSASAGFAAAERREAVATTTAPTAARSRSRPVKILWKPTPKYSEEALQRRVEGDVVLLVRFLSQGTVETLQVVSGLGYGLDEYAMQAAQAIRFEPAIEGNRPVDYTAQVRIRFELAY